MGRGTLYWTHPHSVDLILFAAGSRVPEAIQARLSSVVQGGSAVSLISDPVVDTATIYFTDGVAGHIGRAPGADLVLSCESGEITVLNDGESIQLSVSEEPNPYLARGPWAGWHDKAGAQGTLAPVQQLVRCLQGDVQAQGLNALIKQHMLDGQRILFAMAQSHLERSRLLSPTDVDPAMCIQARTGERFA
jgi:hypothetical protein